MKTIINIIVDNDGYIIAKPDGNGEYVKVMPQGIQRIPCIPFYQSAWFATGKDVRPAVSDFAQAANLLHGGIKGCSALVACPADAIVADRIMIKENFEVAGIKKPRLISKTELGQVLKYTEYIAISVSERLLIVEWYKDSVVAEVKYYNKASISKKKLYADISNIRQKSDSKIKILIFDACNELTGIYDMGTVIDAPRMIELLKTMSQAVFNKKTLEEIFEEEEISEADYSDEESQVIPNEIVFGEQDEIR